MVPAVGVVAMTLLLAVAGWTDSVEGVLGGWSWLAAGFAAVEAVLVVFGPVWLLDLAQRFLEHPLPGGEHLDRGAHAAFMLQTVFLLGLSVALRPVSVPAEAKALLVAAGAVWASFAAGWLLVSRVPGAARVL